MTRRILIPTEDEDAEVVAPHFGRAPYFAMFELDTSNKIARKSVHENAGSHRGGRGHAHDNVMLLKPHVIIVRGMGPRGIRSFQEAEIAVLRASGDMTESVLEAYIEGLLSELTEGCAEAHHK